ncbi:MAG: helix-turn-helix transcriptional regulator [Saccharospirillum sp.]|nr:helix-turn-helix transcriptional regulator [Saccharospirillum sp.]
MNTVAERIKAARAAKKMSQNELANRCGWPEMQARISNYEKGRTEPAYADLVKIAKVLSVDPAYLAFGEKPSNNSLAKPSTPYSLYLKPSNEFEYLPSQIDPWDGQTPLDQDEVELPFFTDVELAAGVGSMLANERIGPKLRFAKSTLKRAGVPAEAAVCVKVYGESMEPALPDGSVVGINTADKVVRDGKIYAIEHGGLLRVKIMQNLPHGGFRLRSYNSAEYPDEAVSPEEAESVKIIGRVFWSSVLY